MNAPVAACLPEAAEALLSDLAGWRPTPDPAAGDDGWLADFRSQTAALSRFSGSAQPLHDVLHIVLPSSGGPLPMRLYRPAPGPLPVLLHLHGGGAIAGSVDNHDIPLRAMAVRTGWAIAAPDYRLAPAFRFPAQLDDAEAALRWLVTRGHEYDLDRDRIVVSGDSIGATLATALAVRARDAGWPVAGQVLLYPNTDLRAGAAYPSRLSEDGRIIASADLERQIALYLDGPRDRSDPEASPLLQTRLSGSPPTLLITCHADPLRDEGELYGHRLVEAGVDVDHRRLDGALHAVLQMGGKVEETGKLLECLTAWLAIRGSNLQTHEQTAGRSGSPP